MLRFFPLKYMWPVTQKGTSWVDDVVLRNDVFKVDVIIH